MPKQTLTSTISKRVSAIAPSATLAVTSKAKALKDAGHKVISFGAGQPDFPTPDYIIEAAIAAAKDPAYHGYTATAGLPALREAIAAKTFRDSKYEVDPNQVVVTNGGKQAVYNSLTALLNPGDEVIIPAPFWTSYPEPIRLAQAKPVIVQTGLETGFRVTVDALEKARTANTKALIFVSPSNPTGAIYPKEEIEAIAAWAYEHDIWVVCDEIYEHLVFAGNEHHSVAALAPELSERVIVLNGVAKTYAMTGWRVGWMIAPPEIVSAATTLQSHQNSNVNNIAQMAALAAVAGPLDPVYEMREAFDRRRIEIYRRLKAIDGFKLSEPQGAFYAFASVEELLGRSYNGSVANTSAQLAEILLNEIHVAAVPGEAFHAPGYMRFSYALSDSDLTEGMDRLEKLINESQ